MRKELEELYLGLEQKFGRNNQLTVAIEELAELQKELTKAIRGKANDMRIAEEIADVVICLDQISLFFDPDNSKYELFRKFKLDRLKKFFMEGTHE